MPSARRGTVGVRIAAGSGVAVAVLFGGLIVGLPHPPLALHEAGGALLLLAIAAALLAARRVRPPVPGLARSLVGALGALVAMGAAGAALAVGRWPAVWAAVPLALLVLVAAALLDAIRRTVGGPKDPRAEPADRGRSGAGPPPVR